MTLPGQMELNTVIYHDYELFRYPDDAIYVPEDHNKPAGIRLAKMLGQYDDSPSSQLWSNIQRLAREILK